MDYVMNLWLHVREAIIYNVKYIYIFRCREKYRNNKLYNT